jgi:hypothetical protein
VAPSGFVKDRVLPLTVSPRRIRSRSKYDQQAACNTNRGLEDY